MMIPLPELRVWASLLSARQHRLLLLLLIGAAIPYVILVLSITHPIRFIINLIACLFGFTMLLRAIALTRQDIFDNLAQEAAVRVGGRYGRWAILRIFRNHPRLFVEMTWNNPDLPAFRGLQPTDWTEFLSHPDREIREAAFRAFGAAPPTA